MSKSNEETLRQAEQKEKDLNRDLTWEHAQHTDKFYENCSECSKERQELDSHYCLLNRGGSCTAECERLNQKLENTFQCLICRDTGTIEIMGGSEADEWGVIDTRTCNCQIELE